MESQRLLLSFLGTGNYQEVVYTLDGQEYRTPFIQEALVRHFPDHRLMVFLTEEALRKNGQALEERLKKLGHGWEPRLIPGGRSESEHWEIFNTMVNAIPNGASVVMDVTHGFRSQPMLALAVLQFLEVVKGVRTERLLYGAIREEGTGEFLDLTPFLDLVAWTQATRDLMRYGWGKPLAELLSRLQDDHWKRSQGAAKEDRVTQLKRLGDALGQLTLALELLRVEEATDYAAKLLKRADEAAQELGRLPAAEPLGYLLSALKERYSPLAVGDPFGQEGLRAQAAMVEIFLASGSLTQALTLMRELMVTFICLEKRLDPKVERSEAERELGDYAQRSRQGVRNQDEKWGQLWNELADLRNDVAHAGMRFNPTPAKTLEQKLDTLWKKIKEALGLEGTERAWAPPGEG